MSSKVEQKLIGASKIFLISHDILNNTGKMNWWGIASVSAALDTPGPLYGINATRKRRREEIFRPLPLC